jgi:hypothetical protein
MGVRRGTSNRTVSGSEELVSIDGRFAGVLVFEIDVDIGALVEPGVEPLSPGFQLFRRVAFKAQASVGERGGDYVRRRLLFGLGKAKRRLVLTKDGIGLVGVPRRVAHFKGEKESGRAKGKKIFQERTIKFESRRELDEDGAEVVAVVEYAGDFQETFERTLAVAEPFYVRDLLVGLQSEAKTLGDALGPVQKRGLGGHAIEAVIDFDRGELLGVESEHFAIRKLLGVKVSLPLLIGVSRSPDE